MKLGRCFGTCSEHTHTKSILILNLIFDLNMTFFCAVFHISMSAVLNHMTPGQLRFLVSRADVIGHTHDVTLCLKPLAFQIYSRFLAVLNYF